MSLILLELPRGYLLLKHLIQFLETAILCLWKLEIEHDQRDDAGREEDESDSSKKSGTTWCDIEEVRGHDVPNTRVQIVEGETDGLGFGSKSSGRDLTRSCHGWAYRARNAEPKEL